MTCGPSYWVTFIVDKLAHQLFQENFAHIEVKYLACKPVIFEISGNEENDKCSYKFWSLSSISSFNAIHKKGPLCFKHDFDNKIILRQDLSKLDCVDQMSSERELSHYRHNVTTVCCIAIHLLRRRAAWVILHKSSFLTIDSQHEMRLVGLNDSVTTTIYMKCPNGQQNQNILA